MGRAGFGRFGWRGTVARLVSGQSMEVDPRDRVGRAILDQGCSERGTFEFVSRWLRPGMTVIDAGAHVGQYTVLASARVGDTGRVHAFEPHPGLFRMLRRNVRGAGCGNVIANRLALASAPGPRTLTPSPIEITGSGSLDAGEFTDAVDVRATTLDAYVASARLDRVDLVKLDVEDAALEVLDGAADTLAANRDVLLIVEALDEAARRCGHTVSALASRLRALGFRLFATTPRGLEPYAPTGGRAVALIAARRLEVALRGLPEAGAALLLMKLAAAARFDAAPRARGTPRPAARYVVSRRSAGLGDLLVNLLAAWRFARATGRTLVADWRASPYLEDPRRNLFPALFEPVHDLCGVPVVADDDLGDLALPEPYFPAFWTAARLDTPPARPDADVFADRDAAVDLIRRRRDVDAPTVVFDACINHALPSAAASRRVLRQLVPVAAVQDAVGAFHAEQLGKRRVVAVHVRHSNGADLASDHTPYWIDEDAALDRCVRAALQANARLGGDAIVFLATDSPAVVDAFRARVPDVVVRPKLFRRRGAGELHTWPLGFATRTDALVDLLLLARGHALVRFPPGSFFSFYASVMKPAPPRGIPRGVETCPGGRLAPVIVW